jgi:hypothetical protein
MEFCCSWDRPWLAVSVPLGPPQNCALRIVQHKKSPLNILTPGLPRPPQFSGVLPFNIPSVPGSNARIGRPFALFCNSTRLASRRSTPRFWTGLARRRRFLVAALSANRVLPERYWDFGNGSPRCPRRTSASFERDGCTDAREIPLDQKYTIETKFQAPHHPGRLSPDTRIQRAVVQRTAGVSWFGGPPTREATTQQFEEDSSSLHPGTSPPKRLDSVHSRAHP